MPTSSPDKEILYIVTSHDETKIGVAIGIKLIKRQMTFTDIVVYKKYFDGKYQLETNREFNYPDACKQFFFD